MAKRYDIKRIVNINNIEIAKRGNKLQAIYIQLLKTK